MVCGSLSSIDSACNFCGCFGSMFCAKGRKEQVCDFCNHCFCLGPSCMECCPCGATGCIGFPNHLCGCCGNCNLHWYADCCMPCLIADLVIATDTTGEKSAEWNNIVCNCITAGILMLLCQVLGGIVSPLMNNVSNVIELVVYIYMMVVFGYAATKIAQKKGFTYEPEDCCNKCYNEGCCSTCGSCPTSFNCCCAYWCCFALHVLQVARAIEDDDNMQSAIVDGRPTDCQCCNCWKTAVPVQLTTSAPNMAV